jgi:uncharacterized protein YbjT (DUF2867 family)
MPTYAVAGVTGHVGGVVAQTLLDQQRKVRVLVRETAKGERWRKRGAEVGVTDLGNAHDLASALRGAEAAFLMLPPMPPSTTGVRGRAKRMLDAMVQAVGATDLKHVVFLSMQGAQHNDGTGIVVLLHDAEQEFRTLKTPVTFLRPTYFVENWGRALPDAKEGLLESFFPIDFRHPHVATHDVGKVAAELVLEHPKGHRVVELAGAEEASSAEVAAMLSRLLGSEVEPVEEPIEDVTPALTHVGFSPELAGLYQGLYQGIVSGRIAFEHPETARHGKDGIEHTLGQMLSRL